jgi:membrane protease YdiL (CAAX protease family)
VTAARGSAVPLIVLGPLSEELGWRGYALRRLQTRMGALASSVVIGVVWALWHLPLFYMIGTSQSEANAPFLAFALAVVSTSVLYTWLSNNTGGSIFSAVFLHWIYTYAVQVIWTAGERPGAYDWLEPLPYVVLAVIVVAVWGPRRLSRNEKSEVVS